MEAHTRSPRDLFEGKEHYEIPAFQRPYVWNEEFQWAPLWDDVIRVSRRYVEARLAAPDEKVEAHHFLGAVVYESQIKATGDVTRHAVIDGQQRMTTLQLMLDAVHEVVASRGHEDLAESLEELILNKSARFAGKRERFKLWPSQADRQAFSDAMDPQPSATATGEHPIGEAHRFFRSEALDWIEGVADDDGNSPPGDETLRVEALCSTIQDRLVLVAIDLTGHDDSQLIFETLNDRGTPLLKADLIKNWLFRKGEAVGADVDKWAETYWADFDTTWWRDEVRQGRLVRSRVDIFLQYWLTMRRKDEIKSENAFRAFVEYADPLSTSATTLDDLLAELRQDADTYRSFAGLDRETPEGRFYHRVIERLELAATTPVFLWLLSRNHEVDPVQRRMGLDALESWAVRRTLLRSTTKDVNKFAVSILRELEEAAPEEVGQGLHRYLSEQTAETRVWPTDAIITARLPSLRLYGNLRRDRLRVILSALEQLLRSKSSKFEAVSVPAGLEIEHVMPQGWRHHWDQEPPLDPHQAAERDHLINTLGNLTLTTKSLNGSLSNRPWTDVAANGLKEGGRPDRGKRSLLDEFSLLVLNKDILKDSHESWGEEDIMERSVRLVAGICEVWPGPDVSVQEQAISAKTAVEGDAEGKESQPELPAVPWTNDEVQQLANEVGDTLKIVLDVLAAHPGTRWTNADFKKAGHTDYAFAALGAFTVKVQGRFQRGNVPVIYQRVGGDWHWSLENEFAALWRGARGEGSDNQPAMSIGAPTEDVDVSHKFGLAMRDVYSNAKKEAGYNATVYLRMLTDHGPLGTARKLIHAPTVSDGYTALYERGRLDLTVENVVLQPEFESLFTDDERETARARLVEFGFDPGTGHD